MADETRFLHILNQKQLRDFCEASKSSKFIGFDTEFVSENLYRPQLCLIQVVTDHEIALIDALAVQDVGPFWHLITRGNHVTVAHAAREEFLFCFRACGKRPKNMFDVQLAAGFAGLEYPASYSTLVAQLLGEFVAKGETRTDWQRRPLSDKQIRYAVQDVVFLRRLHEKISRGLNQFKRMDWYEQEVDLWFDALERTETQPQWHRVSGITKLNRRALAVLRELWIYRDSEAKKKNRSPRRILPDDLMVELAKRGSSTHSSFKAIRGFESRVSKGMAAGITAAIDDANRLTDAQLPPRLARSKSLNLGLLGQFLTTALHVVCRSQNISPALVGTAEDTRNLAAIKLGLLNMDHPPELSIGWRREIVGQVIEQAIEGKIALRVDDPNSDHPLKIEYLCD